MLGHLRNAALRDSQTQALERLQDWTRARFALDAEQVVMAAELRCALPGCPPLETVVVFWTAPDARHQFKLFKPAQQVQPEDLPYVWQKNGLRVDAGTGCDCC